MGSNIPIDGSLKVRRVLLVTLGLNVSVALAKIFYGSFSDSISILSDGFHSMFDGVSNILGLIGIWIAAHPPDRDHPYGHKKYETLFTVIIALMIFLTSFQILKKVYISLSSEPRTVVSETSFVIMLLTMAVNIFVSRYEFRRGTELRSDLLIADSLHTKSDIITSSAVIVGLVFVKLGFPSADALIGLVIAGCVAKIGLRILKRATDVLVDSVCIDTPLIEALVKRIEGVRGCHDIRTRGSESAVYVDMHVLVAPEMTTDKAHEVADLIEESVKSEFPSVVDVVVHIEPDGKG